MKVPYKFCFYFLVILIVSSVQCTGQTTSQQSGIAGQNVGDPLEDWRDVFNSGQSMDSLYLTNALSVRTNGEVFNSMPAIAAQHKIWKKEMGAIQSIQTIRKVAARPNIDYEIGALTDSNGQTYKSLLIWRKQKGQILRELEIIAKGNSEVEYQKEIDEARKEWMTLCNQHDAQKLVAQKYTVNAIYYNHRPVLIGTDAVTKEYSYMNNPKYSLTLTPIILEPVNEKIAFEIGQCSGSYGGKYILVWEKTKDGNWKVLFDANF